MRAKWGYQDQGATMTLREGIEEYYRANPHLFIPPEAAPEAVEFFRCHDRIHVVFGCDTSFVHEVRADCWTFFGSDLGLRYLRFLTGPVQLLMKDLKERAATNPSLRAQMRVELQHSVRATLGSPFQVFARTRRMTKKWPWSASATQLDRPLAAIRNEYGIRVLD